MKEKIGLWGRKGEEIVEAAIVLPVLILTILSLIMLILYYFSCLETQLATHGDLIGEAAVSDVMFQRMEKSFTVSSEMDGLISLLMKKDGQAFLYAMRPAELLRTGEMIGL